MRVCSQCGAQDRDLGAGEHLVVPEIRYLKSAEDFTPSRRGGTRGWSERVFQGRPAMERMICRPCLVEAETRDHVWAGMKKEARALEKETEENWYALLCEQM